MNKDTFFDLVFDSKAKPIFYRKITGYYREPVAVRSFTLDFHVENLRFETSVIWIWILQKRGNFH